MNKQQMIEILSQRNVELTEELHRIEREFNSKKEEFLRIQGALEALRELNISEDNSEEISDNT